MLHLIALAALALADAPAPAPAAPAAHPSAAMPRPELILIDDRKTDDKGAALKWQAPAALIDKAIVDIGTRTGVTVARLSEASQKLDARSRVVLSSCNAAPCLAAAGKKLGADVVVTVHVQPQEKVLLLTVARITALATIPNADDSELARTDAEALTVLPDALAKVFPAAKK